MYITHELSSMIIAYVILTFIFYVLNGIIRLIKNPPFRKNICDHLIADFEKRIKECIDIDYEQRFCKWLSDQGSQSVEEVGIKTLLEIFDTMDKEEKQ